MNNSFRFSLLLIVLLGSWQLLNAQHTFSIVAVDPITGEVGGAGATCLNTSGCGGCGGAIIISGILPGRGAASAQATVCIPNTNLNTIMSRLSSGDSAQGALNTVLLFDGCQFGDTSNRQYGIVDLDSANNPRAVSFTGSNALNFAGHRVGPNYAIQGNILIGPQILDSMESGFLNTNGSLCEKLMAALQGANVAGADSRCLSDGVSSKSAFIRVARPTDPLNSFWLDLNVPEVAQGKEPIDSLQVLFDNFKNQVGLPVTPQGDLLLAYPNPGNGLLRLDYRALAPVAPQVEVYDLMGKRLLKQALPAQAGESTLDLRALSNGQPLYVVYSDRTAEVRIVRKIVLHL